GFPPEASLAEPPEAKAAGRKFSRFWVIQTPEMTQKTRFIRKHAENCGNENGCFLAASPPKKLGTIFLPLLFEGPKKIFPLTDHVHLPPPLDWTAWTAGTSPPPRGGGGLATQGSGSDWLEHTPVGFDHF